MRKLCYCSDDGSRVARFETFPDDAQVPTNVGTKRADMLQGSTKATLVAPGHANPSGSVTYTAKHGGVAGNRLFVEQTPGATGAEHASRPLSVTVDPNDEDGVRVLVTFATTGGGFSIRPTAQQVSTLLNSTPAVVEFVSATPGGTGDVATMPPTYLVGGLDDGDWRKFNVHGGGCLRINSVEVL
jgi:hypothetical protein